VPLGYLAYESGMFPKALGVLLVVGGACYLVGLLAVFLFPDVGEKINVLVTIPSAIAEISTVLYLLVVGVKSVKPAARVLAAA
jgi:multisubunit Na+/H+ antiporter MnhG subunit